MSRLFGQKLEYRGSNRRPAPYQ